MAARGNGSGGGFKLTLRKFDMSSISYDKVVVLIGKRETGKSFLVKDLLYHHRDLPIGTVVSPTEHANRFFGALVPPVFIHDEISQSLLHNVVERQRLVLTKMEKQTKAFGSSSIDPRAFLLLDDCMYDKSWINDVNIRLLFCNGRHYKVLFIITQQYPLGIPPQLRTQIDFVFILRENLINNRKRIYDNYAGMFPTFDIFCQVLDATTENFECLVINNNCKSNKLTDQVFWYKAEARPNFTVGAPQFWALSKECEKQRAAACSDDEDDAGGAWGGPGGGQLDDLMTSGAAKPKNRPIVSVRKGAAPG